VSEIKVLIVEDEPIIAEDIAASLDQLDYKVAATAYSSEEALEYLHRFDPDIALLDIQIKGSLDGIDIATIIREKYRIPYVFLTSHSDRLTLDRAKKTVPYGYIVKPFTEKDLLATMEMAMHRYYNESPMGLPDLAQLNQHIEANLSSREYELLEDIRAGLTNQQIAAKRYISINTVKTHLKNLFIKLDVRNRTSALRKVHELCQ
jgi:DNA-binding NarL/FixJ family response regulator